MSAAMRLRGLARKEARQIVRDPSSLLIAFLMPFVLLIVNGYSISFDASHMKLAVVITAPEQETRGLLQALAASPYLAPERVPDTQAAEAAIIAGQVRGALVLREDFPQRLANTVRRPARAQLIANGTDPNTARILEGYVTAALQTWLGGKGIERRSGLAGGVSLDHRYWFNAELRSADAIVPGIIGMVMTMTGTLLTALIVAREWERGTMESMLASPATMTEITLARLGSYFVLGMGSMAVSVLLAIFLFNLPFRGGVMPLLAVSALFLVFALGLGLFISTLARNQFVASQVAFVVTMLPAMLLSGLLFDIASMPRWLQIVTYIVPARYLVSALQTLFLAGDVGDVLWPNLAALAVSAALAVAATLAVTRRRLD